MIEKRLKIEGMSCGHCVAAVEKIINDIEGVTSSTITLPSDAVIVFDESKTNIEDLKKNINDSDIYKAL